MLRVLVCALSGRLYTPSVNELYGRLAVGIAAQLALSHTYIVLIDGVGTLTFSVCL